MIHNTQLLLEKLQALAQNSGAIVFDIGDYYVQFAKNKKTDTEIYFEAVSHHYIRTVPEATSSFLQLGFQIDDGNYYKTVNLADLGGIASDVEHIFTQIYQVNYDTAFGVMEDIDY